MARARNPKTRFALLGMLSIEPMSGYDIRKNIEGSIAHFWNESYGQIYPALKRLAKEGLVNRRASTPSSGRDRQLYAITPKGRGVLRRWLAEPAGQEPVRFELLLKIFFGSNVPMAYTVRQVRAFRDVAAAQLAQYRGLEAEIRRLGPEHADAPFWLMTVRFGYFKAQAAIDWCDEVLSGPAAVHRRAPKKAAPTGGAR